MGLTSLRIAHENHSNSTVIATFANNHFAHHQVQLHGLSAARIIQATITNIKHTTKISDTTILDNHHIITGNTFVGFVFDSLVVSIQFQIIGKLVLSFIQLHPDVAALTWVHANHKTTGKMYIKCVNKYFNTFFIIELKAKI